MQSVQSIRWCDTCTAAHTHSFHSFQAAAEKVRQEAEARRAAAEKVAAEKTAAEASQGELLL
jgi:hypothetical protein